MSSFRTDLLIQELVYSGACEVKNQNACDFRAWNFNGTYLLSAILYTNKNDMTGRAIVMDDSYKVIKEVLPVRTESGMNMHEFNIVEGGRTALYITQRPEYVDVAELRNHSMEQRAREMESYPSEKGIIINIGFREVDIQSGQVEFEWWAYPEVSIAESSTPVQGLGGPFPRGWNWFHGNSVDKDLAGNYILSSRYTDTIYKISGDTGKVIWRLGGLGSDFAMLDGLNFSRQHDAHWVEEECTADVEIITLLDNAGDENVQTATYSSGLKLRLDLQNMTASILQRWFRPDESRSLLRGNFQRLSSDNYLAVWSDNAYMSEHNPDGRLVMEAEFASRRMVTYRAYKQDFVGRPTEPPIVMSFVYGIDAETSTTVSYVSWNGATEVATWNFYNTSGLIGSTLRTGFETRFFSRGMQSMVVAEATAADGTVLGRSEPWDVELPLEWSKDVLSGEPEQHPQGSIVDGSGPADYPIKTEL